VRPREDLGAPRAFVLGGNASTIAFVTSLRSDSKTVTAHLVPIAQTPLGTVCGESWQNVTLGLDGLLDWIDTTFALDDDHAFVAPVRDIELLARINWHVDPPSRLDEHSVLNIEDVPEDVIDALMHAPVRLVQCAACRRLCVQNDFVWKERELCAWDYHRQIFGKRGPWHNGPYESRHFEMIPHAAFVAPPLLEESRAQLVMGVAGVAQSVAREAINVVLASDARRPHMVVRTPDGYTVLREGE
jgi:hypothetical protein